jgi:23S rRNA (pseudouridine1915-N3)-methyltransferase
MARLSGWLDIVAVGRLRGGLWRAAQDEYLRRLQRYATVRLIEVRDCVGKGDPDTVAVRREGEMLLDASAEARLRVGLTHEGQALDSAGLAAFLRRQTAAHGRIAWILGGPLGLSGQVLAACGFRLSLSRMTFPHELARVILLEQLYRGATILSGEGYHK